MEEILKKWKKLEKNWRNFEKTWYEKKLIQFLKTSTEF